MKTKCLEISDLTKKRWIQKCGVVEEKNGDLRSAAKQEKMKGEWRSVAKQRENDRLKNRLDEERQSGATNKSVIF